MDIGPIVTTVGAIFGAVAAAFGTVYVARSKAKTDISTSITAGFEALTNQLQEERAGLQLLVDKLSDTIEKYRARIDELFTENETIKIERRELRSRLFKLEAIIKQAGLELPDAS